FGGQADFPVTYRCTTGGGAQIAAQHSQSPYSMFMHLAGLKIILPSTPADAKGLLKSAIRDNNPVVFFECSRLAGVTGPVPDGDHTVPIGVADVKRAGRDVTVRGLASYVCAAPVPVPYSPTLEQAALPDRGRIEAAIRRVL